MKKTLWTRRFATLFAAYFFLIFGSEAVAPVLPLYVTDLGIGIGTLLLGYVASVSDYRTMYLFSLAGYAAMLVVFFALRKKAIPLQTEGEDRE